MNKIILFIMAVSIGLFIVLAMNNTVIKNDNKTQNNPLSLPTISQSLQQAASSNQTQQIQPSEMPTPTQFATVEEQPRASISATIQTSKGNIVLTLYNSDAPNTVKNFLTKAKNGFYNNLTFHRVEDWVIQGGDPKGNGTGGGSIPVEFNSKPFVSGSLGVASRGDGVTQNDSQFFINKKDAEWLNGKYTNFGIVTEGIEVVNKIKIGDKILGITTE